MFSTDLSARDCDGYAVVALCGELDLADAAVVAEALTAVAAGEPGIVVDLAGLAFIDSSGVAALARGRRQARRAGGDLVLAAPRPRVLRVFSVTRLAEAFAVYATVEEAAGQVRHLRERAGPAPRWPRKGHWPGAVLRSGTHDRRARPGDLWNRHDDDAPPVPAQRPPPSSRLFPPAAGPEA